MVDFDAFNDLDVQILGVSVDDPFSQRTFSESLHLPVPLLSDADAKVTLRYAAETLLPAGTDLTSVMAPGKGIKLQKDRIIATQAFFLVDKRGVLRGRWLPGIEHMSSEKILHMIQSLRDKP